MPTPVAPAPMMAPAPAPAPAPAVAPAAAPAAAQQPSPLPVGQVQNSNALPPVPPVAPIPPVQQPAPAQVQSADVTAQLVQMQQQLEMSTTMNRQLMQQLNAPHTPATPAEPAPEFKPFEYSVPDTMALSEDERRTFGNTYDVVDKLARLRAAEAVKDIMGNINAVSEQVFGMDGKFGDVDRRISDAQMASYNSNLSTAIPGLAEMVQTPEFSQFAGQQVPFTNKTVRQVLAEAHQGQDIAAISNIVNQFRASTGQQQPPAQGALQNMTMPTNNPAAFANPQQPVQAPPLTNYAQPSAYNPQPTAPQVAGGNQALIEQQYEQAKVQLRALKTPDAQAVFDAAAAAMFQMQMGQPQQ